MFVQYETRKWSVGRAGDIKVTEIWIRETTNFLTKNFLKKKEQYIKSIFRNNGYDIL
jgi:hypothetical protein